VTSKSQTGSADVGSHAVIRAVHTLHSRTGNWPTLADVADYLETTEEDARRCLLELRRSRLFRDRQRGGKRVWMPWSES
jgi:hypothetical protein